MVLKKNVTIGGDVSIKDNITIGEDSVIAGASKVFNSFPKGSYIGGSPAQNIQDWKRIVASVKAGSKGGKPGQWSARKAQMLAKEYKAAGGGYK